MDSCPMAALPHLPRYVIIPGPLGPVVPVVPALLAVSANGTTHGVFRWTAGAPPTALSWLAAKSIIALAELAALLTSRLVENCAAECLLNDGALVNTFLRLAGDHNISDETL